MTDKFHKEAFDAATQDKLTLFKESFNGWLAVAANNKFFNGPIQIFDLFSGPGVDGHGIPGSPTIICEGILKLRGSLIKQKKDILLIFNDKDEEKTATLKKQLSKFNFNGLSVKIRFISQEFNTLIIELLPFLKKDSSFNYLFLDQYGVSKITGDLFKQLSIIPRVDLLFFIASSFLTRFTSPEYFTEIDFIDRKKIAELPLQSRQPAIVDAFQDLIKDDREYFMAPFSIKKGSNYYGLIFGTNHIKGLYQFIEACWKVDKLTGESNWLTEEDKHLEMQQLSFLEEANQPNRVNRFEKDLENAILSQEITDNRQILYFTIKKGFRICHARVVWSKMVQSEKVENSRPFSLKAKFWDNKFEIVQIKLKS